MRDIAKEVRAECVGHPDAKIPWPHRVLHKAADELEILTTGGIVEVAVRNPSVMDYMEHWEGRAEKAEGVLRDMETEARVTTRNAGYDLKYIPATSREYVTLMDQFLAAITYRASVERGFVEEQIDWLMKVKGETK